MRTEIITAHILVKYDDEEGFMPPTIPRIAKKLEEGGLVVCSPRIVGSKILIEIDFTKPNEPKATL